MSDDTRHRRDLGYWSDRLEGHFTALRAERDLGSEGAPIFALEHGLRPEEVTSLRELIDDTVGRDKFPPALSLPLATFAAEVGYEYAGLEYWISFEAKVRSWRAHGDREYVRGSLRNFATRFGGAVPRGAWADHFSIICWPITHSILPVDMQRQLARSLFESSRELSTELLEDPVSLGTALAARSWRGSGRYQALAENVDLLGLIASALLAENEGSSPFLTRPVLERLVADLARERQAKIWLTGARSAAHKVRLHGVRQGSDTGREGSAPPVPRSSMPRVTPRLSVQSRGEEWQPFVEIPDLSSLAQRTPDLGEEIARRRLIVGGGEQPEATGTLGMAGLQVRLRSWPRSGKALFELEGVQAATNSALADECSLNGGPPWLFRIGPEGAGTEVRGRAVVPGRRYLVVLEARPVAPKPTWISEASLRVDGASAWLLDSPSSFGPQELSAIAGFDLGAMTEIRVEPVGVTAPSWDGSGGAEWLVGETPMFRIALTAPATEIVCRMADQEARFEPIEGPAGSAVLISFHDLEAGDHEVSILTVGQEGGQPEEAGSLELRIRAPSIRPPTGGPREGMAIIAAPANPTLEEIWASRGLLEVQGPDDVRARLSLTLLDALGGPLAHVNRGVRLPLSQTDWPRIFDASFRHDGEIKRRYPGASACRIVVEHPQLGEVELECFRRFSPLALVPTDHDPASFRVMNNTGDPLRLRQSEFSHPDLFSPLEPPVDSMVKIDKGGLIVAEAGTAGAAVIVLPELDFEAFRNLARTPQLAEQPRTVEGIRSLMSLANRWEEADLPANPIVGRERGRVLEAIGQEVWGLLGSSHWRTVERRFHREDENFAVTDLLGAVGRKDREQAFARKFRAGLNSVGAPSQGERVRCLAGLLATQGDLVGVRRPRVGFAEVVLEVALAPGKVAASGSPYLAGALRELLALSGLFRAVRFALLTEPEQSPQPETTERLP